MNAPRYATTLEQKADFIASDLEDYESRWNGLAVEVIDGLKWGRGGNVLRSKV